MPVKYLKVKKKNVKQGNWLSKFLASKSVVKTRGAAAVASEFTSPKVPKEERSKIGTKKFWWFSLIIALFFIAGLLTYFDVPSRVFNSPWLTRGGARLVVSTEFTPALVYIKDRQLGATPLDVKGLRPGEYKLKLKAVKQQDFFYELTVPAKLQNGITTVVKAQIGPTARTSSYVVLYYDQIKDTKLLVNAKQDKVAVFIDNKKVGETPLLLKNVSAGNHTISLQKQGFRTATFDIIIRDDQTLVIDAKLYEYVLNAH